jgi:hypothetical protein
VWALRVERADTDVGVLEIGWEATEIFLTHRPLP